VREKILAICSACLTDRGVAFISYNALPGWNMRKSLRDMMLFHTAGIADPAARVRQARALLKFLAESVPSDGSAYGMMLKSELETISKVSDNYLFHDHMEKENTAFYFHECMARARPHGLQYLGEAQLAAMNPANFSEGVRTTLHKIGDITVQEQYMDFLRNRLFRQTLLCRSSASLQRNISVEQMKGLSLQASFSVVGTEVDWTPGVASKFRGPNGQQLGTENPLLKGALLALIENRSRAMSFPELLDAARAKVPASVTPVPNASAANEEATLAASLLNMSVKGMVDLFAEPIAAGAALSERPKTDPLTRYQAQRGTTVTNRLHHSLPLDAFGRAVLLVCDGQHTQEQVVDHIVAEAKAQRLQVQVSGKTVTDARRLQGLLRPRVEALLALLARNGLLIA
jgi:methyltransferase-like protein